MTERVTEYARLPVAPRGKRWLRVGSVTHGSGAFPVHGGCTQYAKVAQRDGRDAVYALVDKEAGKHV